MSNGKINAQVMAHLLSATSATSRLSATAPGVEMEVSALRALYVAHEEIDPNELIDDILAVAAQTVSLVIRASHDVDLCRGCMANTVYGYSVEVAAQLAADAAAQEPDEPPFSGSIN